PVGNNRQIAVLERLEVAPGNLRLVGDVAKGQTPPLARVAQELAEVRTTGVVLQDRCHTVARTEGGVEQEFCPKNRAEIKLFEWASTGTVPRDPLRGQSPYANSDSHPGRYCSRRTKALASGESVNSALPASQSSRL